MSYDDDDDMELSDEEIEALYSGSSDDLTPEEVFKLIMVNKQRGVKISVHLEDETGDRIELADVVEGLINYIKDKMKDGDSNDFSSQIMPLMSQAIVSGLGRMIGLRETGFYLANESTRMAMMYMMCVGFLLLKYVQQHNLKIHTVEEEVSEDEMTDIDRKSQASSVGVMARLMGLDPEQILQELVKSGKIDQTTVNDLFKKDPDDNDDE